MKDGTDSAPISGMSTIRNKKSLHEFAPAKINLYLHVLGRRKDGYHLLDSLVVFAGVGDIVTVTPAESFAIRLRGHFAKALSDGHDNIVSKAVHLLSQKVCRVPNVIITLDKCLPVSAGLGGGSADAAATLRVLARLWKVERSAERLFPVARALGADVPVCLHSVPAQISCIGAALQPAPALPSAWLVLVNPLRPLETESVFKTYDAGHAGYSSAMPIAKAPRNARCLSQVLADSRRNDLCESAVTLEPEIRTVLEVLTQLPGCLLARMSGSGATCFGLFADRTAAREAAGILATSRPSWWSTAAPLLQCRHRGSVGLFPKGADGHLSADL